MMAEGKFREDLFYRVTEIALEIPPLRKRVGDAVALAHGFVRRFGVQNSREQLKLSDEALAAIEAHDWPGNVRELENCIKRAAILAEGNMIAAADLGLKVPAERASLNLRQLRDEFDKETVLKALARVDGNIVKASELLGVSRPTLYDILNRLGLRKDRT